ASCESGLCNATGGAPGVCWPLNACGNGKLEAGEGCDDGTLDGTAGDACGTDCKIVNGQPCNATAPGLTSSPSCESNLCSVTGTCLAVGSCNVDADCPTGQWCAEAMHLCSPQLANGQLVPSDPPHSSP